MPNNYQEYVPSRVDLAPVFQRLTQAGLEPAFEILLQDVQLRPFPALGGQLAGTA